MSRAKILVYVLGFFERYHDECIRRSQFIHIKIYIDTVYCNSCRYSILCTTEDRTSRNSTAVFPSHADRPTCHCGCSSFELRRHQAVRCNSWNRFVLVVQWWSLSFKKQVSRNSKDMTQSTLQNDVWYHMLILCFICSWKLRSLQKKTAHSIFSASQIIRFVEDILIDLQIKSD